MREVSTYRFGVVAEVGGQVREALNDRSGEEHEHDDRGHETPCDQPVVSRQRSCHELDVAGKSEGNIELCV